MKEVKIESPRKMNTEEKLTLLTGFALGLWFRHNPGKHLEDFISENPIIAESIGYEKFERPMQ